ncbi:hypothetical protein D3C72_2012190 [compost metagenome]
MVAQHFKDGPAGSAGGLAIVGHARGAASQQGPAHVGGGGVLGAQRLQRRHGGVTVGNGQRQRQEAALADFDLGLDGVG